ncbi:Tegument antigen [Clonorchis sinensis]|uniref:Tegument antigen n=1 Tax=Clonorchis sinensis TaxID=79923 RepID=A0A8T1MHM9_CLOSI|nr:Tegument antigen [Clonorchis sinensis]
MKASFTPETLYDNETRRLLNNTMLHNDPREDAEDTGTITTEDLEKYVVKHDLDGSMPQRWTTLFDPKRTGEITLDMFCEVLGLRRKEVLLRSEYRRASCKPPGLGQDVHVIAANMSIDQQVLISDEARRRLKGVKHGDDLCKLSQELKAFVEEELGPHWQVVIVDGDFWLTFNHIPENSFTFNLNGLSFLFWKTS